MSLRRTIRRWLPRPISANDFLAPTAMAPQLAQRVTGEVARLFFETKERAAHKWVHYLPIYERHFAQFRGTSVALLEIGVKHGGSLDLWRRYLGPDAVIFGIDINPVCAGAAEPPTRVRIGSQADPAFLLGVIEEMGSPDIILDDGSHVASHQRISFETLFPRLKEGGLYVIEDLQTAYWGKPYDGGYRRPGTAIELVKQMIDDMHAWYHRRPTRTPAKDGVGAIHVYDGMVVVEKRGRPAPAHIVIGP